MKALQINEQDFTETVAGSVKGISEEEVQP